MRVFNLLKNLWQRVKSYSDSNLQTAKDYTDTVVEAQTQVYTANWTASQGTTIYQRMTDSLTLTKGKYIIGYRTPIGSANHTFSLLINGEIPMNTIGTGTNYVEAVKAVELTQATNTVFVVVVASGTVNFSYLDRGGLWAVKIAEIGGVLTKVFNLLSRKVVTA